MNLHDRPTPRTNQLVREQLGRLGMTPRALAAKLTMHSEQLEREAAAWREVAEMQREASTKAEVAEADKALDALREKVDG